MGEPRRLRCACSGLPVVIALMLILNACGSLESRPPLPTASAVDLSRYMGLWYEIARLPMWAQRKCDASTAEYRLRDSGGVAVRNACVTASGEMLSIEGTATVVDPTTRAKLHVVFDQWAAKVVAWFRASDQGNYWILRVDSDYRTAVVGSPDREYLWILSRTPTLDESVYQDLVSFSRQLGFQTDRLMRVVPKSSGSVGPADVNIDNPALGRKAE